jgi:hypothetical protein
LGQRPGLDLEKYTGARQVPCFEQEVAFDYSEIVNSVPKELQQAARGGRNPS